MTFSMIMSQSYTYTTHSYSLIWASMHDVIDLEDWCIYTNIIYIMGHNTFLSCPGLPKTVLGMSQVGDRVGDRGRGHPRRVVGHTSHFCLEFRLVHIIIIAESEALLCLLQTCLTNKNFKDHSVFL